MEVFLNSLGTTEKELCHPQKFGWGFCPTVNCADLWTTCWHWFQCQCQFYSRSWPWLPSRWHGRHSKLSSFIQKVSPQLIKAN